MYNLSKPLGYHSDVHGWRWDESRLAERAIEYEQEEQYLIKTHPLPRELARDELELKVRIFHLENLLWLRLRTKSGCSYCKSLTRRTDRP